MAHPALALDLTRLALAPVRRAPRGIDRVELAYARHFLTQWPGECLPVLPMPWGVRCYERERGLVFLDAVDAHWRERIDPTRDRLYRDTKAFLRGDPVPDARILRRAKPGMVEQGRAFMQLLARTGLVAGRAAHRALPRGAVYLNVGQLEVFRLCLSWLSRRPDVLPVFMIHDLIPLELPEHHLEIGIRLHRRIVGNTAEFAGAIIVPSKAVAGSVRKAVAEAGRRDVTIHAETLAVGPEFTGPFTADPELPATPYFVIVGAIDSYKNHLLTLRIWRELVRSMPTPPKLVIAGSPGVTADEVMTFLASEPGLRETVMLSSGLSTAALRQLIAGARALLMPSLAEGFGLPIIEALAQGTAVLASDIPAHREAGRGGEVTYLEASDEDAWRRAIVELSMTQVRQPAGLYQPKTWDDYFGGISGFLLDAAARHAQSRQGADPIPGDARRSV